MTAPRPSRRRLLAAVGGLTALAGCLGSDGGSQASPETTEPATDEIDTLSTTGSGETETDTSAAGTTGTEAPGTETTAGDLDLREANVTAVEVERSGDAYRFSVTLIHDDDGEDGYANWWQVEALDGTELGRRELLHAHGTREFTRSETVEVPAGTTCVVVRGHDQTHGYGGQAMLVTLETAATKAVRQGSEPQSFADAECP